MFQGQFLPSGATVYSPWFDRRGDCLKATVDLIDNGSSGQIAIDVVTKNREDTGNGVAASGTLTTSTVGQSSSQWGPSALKELVRYKYTVTTDGVLFRMLEPVWFDSVEA